MLRVKKILVYEIKITNTKKRIISQLLRHFTLTTIFLFLSLAHVSGQQTFRRHFIIAYDISAPFTKAEKNCPAYKKALIDLFTNKSVHNFKEAYQDNLIIEKENNLLFFDENKDEISFFHFNISGHEFRDLRNIAHSRNEHDIISSFNKCFLKNKSFYWSAFSSGKQEVKVTDYITDVLSIRPTPVDFNSGVSMSNFVYPLVLDKIDQTKFAEEYILIILSDFLTGSMLGNTKDLDRVRDIYRIPYHAAIPANSPVGFIKKQIDFLASQYYKIDFFQYSFLPGHTNDAIGIIAYKVKPKIGILTPEDVALFIDGDLKLNQKGYQSRYFDTNKTFIKFTHNDNLILSEAKLRILLPTGHTEKVIFDDIIAQKEENTDAWKSPYTSDRYLMRFDSSALTYYLPRLKLMVDPAINEKDFKNLKFIYELKSKYKVANTPSLNFIYKTERALPIENINYTTKVTIIIMYYLLPALAVLLLVIILVAYGKPLKIYFHLDGYLDSFEKTDYNTGGKLFTPYKAWNYELQGNTDLLLVKGFVRFKSENYPFNWNSPIHLRLQIEKLPAGFDLFLKHAVNDIKEFDADIPTAIYKRKDGNLSFWVGIRQTDITRQIVEPELVRFSVEAVIKDSGLGFIKSEIRKNIVYQFHIGADLSDVWVGFDPGTTGSCVAVGSSSENILLGEDKAKNKIIPSVITFDKDANYLNRSVHKNIYAYGEKARTVFNTSDYGFKSIKKLLGYKDIKEIHFNNGNTLQLKGKDLAALLVKGLFKDVNTYFNRTDFNADEYKRNGQFNPLRAVVAIPNNFTAGKIQDMIDCIANLNQFKEIRYVYEAEAVLFYYLSNYSKYNPGNTTFETETILVFDMGGATINATVVTATKTFINKRPKYKIDLLGKIGYGIGGDTIDYCICKFILSFAGEFHSFNGIDILDKKDKLAELAYEVKVEMVENYTQGRNYLITAYNLENIINSKLDLSITIDENESEMYQYFLKSNTGEYKLFKHIIFAQIIYNNVKDAANEVLALSGNPLVDKIIFSGRSTAFPMIKETVENQLQTKDNNIESIALNLEESKVAVAIGACWYGINKNSIRLNNLKTNASFGFKKTLSADKRDVKYYELIEMGCNFEADNDGIGYFRGEESIVDDFAFDGSKVNFYQVMGKDADKILSLQQKHKFSKIATIGIEQVTSVVAMQVNENDEVDCRVRLQSNRTLNEKGAVADQEIDEANEEHYTWMVK